MSEELGKIEKPSAEQFGGGRKLFYVPLLFTPRRPEPDFDEMVNRYWDQVADQIANLEEKLGGVTRVYHELVPVGGEEGAAVIEELNAASYRIIRKWLDSGAELQPIEDAPELAEFMDWSRCLAIGLQSSKAVTKVYEFYSEVRKQRNEHISKRIDETLKECEIGVVLMREGHEVQYPAGVQVFYVAPPALDAIHRWIRAREEEAQKKSEEDSQHPG